MATKTKGNTQTNLFGTHLVVITQSASGVSENFEKTWWGKDHCKDAVEYMVALLKGNRKGRLPTKNTLVGHYFEPVAREASAVV